MENPQHESPMLQYRSPGTSNWTRLRVAWLLWLIVFGALVLTVIAVDVYRNTSAR